MLTIITNFACISLTLQKELKKHGVEVVQADLNDVESLKKAFHGAHGVFGVTNFWECWYDAEIKQGKNIADAAKAAGVK
jgi:uncharacterized protein YbjT (DUF2867 family)